MLTPSQIKSLSESFARILASSPELQSEVSILFAGGNKKTPVRQKTKSEMRKEAMIQYNKKAHKQKLDAE